MSEGSATQRIRRLETLRRTAAVAMHTARQLVTPALRGQLGHNTIISTATYSPWQVDEGFRAMLGSMAACTLLDDMRLYELWQLSDQVGDLRGDAIEIGCWRGGAGCLVAHRLAQRQPGTPMFLCDTFAGVVKAGARDSVYVGGEHDDADEATVRALAARLGLTNVDVLVGIFPDDTGEAVSDRTFKFAHIDVDVYEGARDSFSWLLPRLVLGGIVVFDDYGSSTTDGIRTVIDELHGHPDVALVRNLNGQAVAVRRRLTTPGPAEA